MADQFKKHYTRDEARALLPQVRQWLGRLEQLRSDLQEQDERITALLLPGVDLGGPLVNQWVRTLSEIKEVLFEFFRREIQLKDLERGLIDFPAYIGEREVFLCWEMGEQDIEFWHDLDSGYAGREHL